MIDKLRDALERIAAMDVPSEAWMQRPYLLMAIRIASEAIAADRAPTTTGEQP